MEKVCSQCGVSKDAEKGFYFRRIAENKRREECKDCSKKRDQTPSARASQKKCMTRWRQMYPERAKANHQKWRDANRDHLRNERLKNLFNIDIQVYDRMLADQGGACSICRNFPKEGRRLSVDHDHKCCSGYTSCGKCVRGLLCQKCNALLGFARDTIQIFDNAKDYLKRYGNAETIFRPEGSSGSGVEQISHAD